MSKVREKREKELSPFDSKKNINFPRNGTNTAKKRNHQLLMLPKFTQFDYINTSCLSGILRKKRKQAMYVELLGIFVHNRTRWWSSTSPFLNELRHPVWDLPAQADAIFIIPTKIIPAIEQAIYSNNYDIPNMNDGS